MLWRRWNKLRRLLLGVWKLCLWGRSLGLGHCGLCGSLLDDLSKDFRIDEVEQEQRLKECIGELRRTTQKFGGFCGVGGRKIFHLRQYTEKLFWRKGGECFGDYVGGCETVRNIGAGWQRREEGSIGGDGRLWVPIWRKCLLAWVLLRLLWILTARIVFVAHMREVHSEISTHDLVVIEVPHG